MSAAESQMTQATCKTEAVSREKNDAIKAFAEELTADFGGEYVGDVNFLIAVRAVRAFWGRGEHEPREDMDPLGKPEGQEML